MLEKMSDFFAARIDGYEEHMLNNVEGCREGYIKMAELVPEGTKALLDLGCGTGLELDEIFKRLPDIAVVGIDLCQEILNILRNKHPDRNMKLICGNYFDVDLGENAFDTAISFQTMHHFSHPEKIALYTKLCKALKEKGVYIEADYMVMEQAEEDRWFAESARLRQEMKVPDGELYHLDTPCTVANQIAMLRKAGFASAEMVWRVGNTTIVVARK